MKPTSNQSVPHRVASRIPFLFSVNNLAVVLCFIFSAICLQAEETPAGQEHLKAKSWRDRRRLILRQTIGMLLKAESPRDFSRFIQTGREIELVKLRF
jgi:hypothetical protein